METLKRAYTVGTYVFIHKPQKISDHQWSKSGEIVEILPNRRQYCVKCKMTGRIALRNRRYIKPLPTPPSQTIPYPIISPGIIPNLTGKEFSNHRNLT